MNSYCTAWLLKKTAKVWLLRKTGIARAWMLRLTGTGIELTVVAKLNKLELS